MTRHKIIAIATICGAVLGAFFSGRNTAPAHTKLVVPCAGPKALCPAQKPYAGVSYVAIHGHVWKNSSAWNGHRFHNRWSYVEDPSKAVLLSLRAAAR